MSSTARLTNFVKGCCDITFQMRFNMKTLNQLTLPFTGGGWMSSREDSPANRSALQASEEARAIIATSGRRCYEQFARLPLVGSWAKMFSALLIGRTDWFSTRCVLTWKMQATKCSRLLFRLVPSMRHTDEIACGSLPTVGMLKTPSSMDSKESLAHAKRTPVSGNSGCLAQEIANGWAERRGLLLPTVVTQGLKYCNEKGQSAFVKAELLPTPCANEAYKGQRRLNPNSQNGMALTARMANHMLPGEYQVGEHSRLSPLFVAEMMGFPPDWTLAPFLNGCEVTEDSDSADTGEEKA